MQRLRIFPLLALGLALLGAALFATAGSTDKAGATKVAFTTSEPPAASALATTATTEEGTYVFGTPPGAAYDQELAKYQPIAEHLSRVTGKRFVYRPSSDWLSYSKNMSSGAYDLVFDGPVSTGWRIDRINHAPLVKLPDDMVYVVIAPADGKISQLKQLAGHRVCAIAPPDVGTLTLLAQFDNPARQPVIVEAKTWQETYQGVSDGKCTAGVVSRKNLDTINNGSLRVLYQHRPLPNYAFSASSRLSSDMKQKIRDALLSPSGKIATSKLRAAHGGGDFVPATPAEYAGLGKLLKDSLYYY